MKTSIRVIAAVAICLAAQSTFSQPMTMIGSIDCGQWLAEKTPARRNWLAGYLSGLNVMWGGNGRKGDPLARLSSTDQAYAWIDNYCRKNPLEKLSDGALMLFVELAKKEETARK